MISRFYLPAGVLAGIAILASSCSGPESIPPAFRDKKLPLERRVSDLTGRMRPDEKVALVQEAQSLSMRGNSRLGIPALRVVTAPMGLTGKDPDGRSLAATAFPANIGMAATWNPSLMERVGVVIAQQAKAWGRGQVLGPLADVSHSPLSGRVFETYGEDPWLVSRMAVAWISGVQGEGEIATAIYRGGPTNTRGARESDVRPIEAAVSEAGVWAVMPQDGIPVRGFLNGQLGFRGFSVLNTGMESNAGTGPLLDEQVRGILRAMFASGAFDREPTASREVETAEHRTVAREAATQSMVLLKNEGSLLPLDKSKIHSVAVIGPNANVNRMAAGNYTVGGARYSATPLDALRGALGSGVVTLAKTPAEAGKAEVAIVFAGTGAESEGESHDRTSLNLPAGQDELIEAVVRANPHTIVVVNSGSAIAMAKWIGRVPAVVEAWFPGEEGGNGIADVLAGKVNPSGRLPIGFPARMENPQQGDLFPFGFGLSYTQFEYRDLRVTPPHVSEGQLAEVSVTIRNTGTRTGKETAQLYLHATRSDASIERAVQDLRGFQQVELKPGESARVRFTVSGALTAYFDEKRQDWMQDQAEFEIRVGSSSRDIRATGVLSVSE